MLLFLRYYVVSFIKDCIYLINQLDDKNQKNLLLIFYFLSISCFTLTSFFYYPRPRLKKLDLIEREFDQINIVKVFLRKNLKNREINIGNRYIVLLKDDLTFQITALSFWDISYFSLSDYVDSLPSIIFDADQIKV